MKEHKSGERRRYIRLKSVFPVEFKLLSPDTKEIFLEFMQGFTSNVSKGGILLRINNVKPQVVDILEKRQAKLLLKIDMPLVGSPVEAISKIAWMCMVKEENRDACLIGLSFDRIDARDRRRLVGYAASMYRVPRLTAVALSVLIVTLGINRAEEINLRRENILLVERLAGLLQKRSVIVAWLDEGEREKEILIARLEAEGKDKKVLEEKLDSIVRRERVRLEELKAIEEMRQDLEKATVDNMYNWLKNHQNKRTGLIASYEGDRTLKNTAFIYDQSLAVQVFLLMDDFKRARSMLDFFKYNAKRHKGAFTNAYGTNTGSIAEYTVHTGPNIWLGIASLQYLDKTKSEEYLDLAEDIASWVVKIQEEDKEGGIRGGPDVTWFSTEHNLDGYALLTMLAQKTKKDKYKIAAQRALNWIRENAYTAKEGMLFRGKGDSTIATDTFSWAIAAIGPKRLIENGMDPDAIMEFAEENCRVNVDFERPDGKIVKVTGFDFAKQKNIARGGVVSSEWTAQMIVSLRIMSDFYLKMGDYKKAKAYEDKSSFYLNELERMVIASPSRLGQGAGCFPYATMDNVDTGHGWRTPHGRDTGSVSGTAYGIFAIEGYNPLKLASAE